VSDAHADTAASTAQERFGGALARVQAQRQGIVSKDFLTLRVPGYEDLLVRYRLLPEKQSEDIGRKVEALQRSNASNKKVMEVSADLLVEACHAILVRVEDGGDFEELVGDGERPVRFDAQFAELMGLSDVDESRQIVLEVFSPEGDDGLRRNPDAITDHLNAIGLWRKGRLHEIDQGLLGE
jgi:hypothetical protein